MAIKKKVDKSSSVELPAKIDQLALKAFTEQWMTNKYDSVYNETKDQLLKEIEVSELELTMGESFKTNYGTILINETQRKKVDNDKIIDLVKSKKISLEQVLACVSTFKNEELEKAISSAVFNTIVTVSVTQSTTLKSNAEFKAKCEAEFNQEKPSVTMDVPKALKEIKPLPISGKNSVAHEHSKPSSKDKLKKAMAKTKPVDDDLDSILNS